MTAICSICQEKLTSGKTFALSLCGHVCCDDCLLQWASRNNPPNRLECPMCRKKHSYPKNTVKLFFEEEKSEGEMLRAEIRSVMKLVEDCVKEPNEAGLKRVLKELKSVSSNAKKLKEPQATASMINGLDAMISHLSKKLAPVQSTDQLNAELDAARKANERLLGENARLARHSASLEARNSSYVQDMRVLAENCTTLTLARDESVRESSHLRDQLQRQRQHVSALEKQLAKCEQTKDTAREQLLALKKRYKNMSETNKSLTLEVNRALANKNAADRSAMPPPASRISRKESIVSIRSDSSGPNDANTPITLLDSDEEAPQGGSESSDVEFISESEDADMDPRPNFRELKPVKKPVALFPIPQAASASRTPTAPKPTVQKRRLALMSSNSGVELRNGRTTSLVALGPKRSRRSA
ncbi:cytoplasmic protein [Ceratobasidium sp. AG-Ba]|nr:cytoplasmic protein [Ceratobasidium sp. AG-Ba]QRV91066.1 cytoplasmic protein [Ceratobasidium sp. AG-Ba]QRW05154.1 cytoplasmic protein [Ceratobasidium sp. AG-Ba]